MLRICKAYPRHSVDITLAEYRKIISLLFSKHMLNGEYIKRFERMFAKYISTTYAVSIPSARLGLYLLLKNFNFPQQTEIIITPFTHQSIFTVIKAFGFKPVFIDIDEKTYNITPQAVKKRLNEKTKVLILTHMWGQPCDMGGFMKLKEEYGITIIEDCAMACGAEYKEQKVGSFGDASIFSFGKAKAISTFGGGMLCTNNAGINQHVRRFTENFKDSKPLKLRVAVSNSILANILTRPHLFYFTLYPVLRFLNIRDPYNPIEHKKDSSVILDEIPPEWKIKLSNLQAAVGIEQLNNLDKHNQMRMKNAQILNKILSNIDSIRIPSALPQAKHIYLYYTLFVKKFGDLNLLRKKLINFRIDSQLNELTTPQQLEIFGVNSNDYPNFKKIAERLLIIPNGIYLSERDVFYVAATCEKVFKNI